MNNKGRILEIKLKFDVVVVIFFLLVWNLCMYDYLLLQAANPYLMDSLCSLP